MKYRKLPVEVEAIKYLGHGNVEGHDVPDWMWDAFENKTLMPTNGDDPLYVETLKGNRILSPGDYLVRGVKDELYPVKPDIFEQTYERVEESNA